MEPAKLSGRISLGKWLLVTGISAFAIVFLWHLYLVNSIVREISERQASIENAYDEVKVSVNPITNLVSISVPLPPEVDEDNPFAGLGQTLGEMFIQAIGPGAIERELNVTSRKKFDVYAMVLPYQVSITTEPASDEAVARAREEHTRRLEREERERADELARIQAEAEERRQQWEQERTEAEETRRQARLAAERERAEAEAEQRRVMESYIRSSVSLENVRVAPGERFGMRVVGVFGTVANTGDQTLTRVRVRIFFLDDAGQRIGEKEYSPVLVSTFSVGDNTPLRPGYRRDFGYSVEDHAPSGWAQEIDADIVEVEFEE